MLGFCDLSIKTLSFFKHKEVRLWEQGYFVRVSASLPCALSFTALHSSAEERALSAPPWHVFVTSRIEAATHKAQIYKLFLLRHQALEQMHPICTHPLWTGHSWGYTSCGTPTHCSIGHSANTWDKQLDTTFECGESHHSFQSMGLQHILTCKPAETSQPPQLKQEESSSSTV